MKKICEIKGKLSLLLIFAILVLCAGFLIMSCGDPQMKTKDTNKGAYAIDFSLCPVSSCSAQPQGSHVNPVPDITDREVTMEAWIKSKVTSTISGNIFKRFAGWGAKLSVNSNGHPEFSIGRVPITTEPTGCTTSLTSTECVIDSGVSLVQDMWTHIAGVLTNSAHSHATSTSCTTAVMAQRPHLDMYVNGVLAECSTTASLFAKNPGDEAINIGPLNDAVIDELRFWVTARTEAEIKNCMNKELGIGGDCDRGDPDLAAYYRLNEGEGDGVTDFSGNGFAGAFEYGLGNAVFVPWENGWVATGNPNLQQVD